MRKIKRLRALGIHRKVLSLSECGKPVLRKKRYLIYILLKTNVNLFFFFTMSAFE